MKNRDETPQWSFLAGADFEKEEVDKMMPDRVIQRNTKRK